MMRPHPMVALVLVLGALAGAAEGNKAYGEKAFVIAPGPVRSGHVEDDLKDAQGDMVIHYAMDVPATLPEARRLGLIVAFHGNTHTAEHHAAVWKDVVATGKLDQEYIVLALKSQGSGWAKVDDPRVTAAIDWALATYPIDRRRVHLVGFSSGAFYSGTYGLAHQERFATVSMYCCAFAIPPLPNGDRESAPGIYMMFGTADGFLPGTPGREMRERLRAAGYRYVYREIAGGGHDFGPGTVITQDNLRLIHQSRSRQVPLEPEQAALIQRGRDAKKAEGLWRSPLSAAELLYIGGQWAEAVALKAIKGKDETAKLNVARGASAGLFGIETLVAMGRNLAGRSPTLRKQSIAALAPAANWNWPEAKAILAEFALQPDNAVDERLAAVQALADAATLISLAEKYDDNVVIPTLVKLLDDAQPPLRAAAFAALKPLNADVSGYDPAARPRGRHGRTPGAASSPTSSPRRSEPVGTVRPGCRFPSSPRRHGCGACARHPSSCCRPRAAWSASRPISPRWSPTRCGRGTAGR